MPRTASIQKSLRAARKSRPNQISAPVLFRFPDLCDTATEQEQSPEATNQPTERVAGEADVGVSSASVTASTVGTTTAVVSSAESTEPAPASDKEDAALVAALTSKTWWEHWSSGIVLLLLVGALLFASAMAFNNTSSPDPDNLAGGDHDELAIPSLGDIEIPEIDTQLSLPEPTLPAVEPENSTSEPAESPKHTLAPSAPTLSSSSGSDVSADSLESMDSLIPPSLAIDDADVATTNTPSIQPSSNQSTTTTDPRLAIKVEPSTPVTSSDNPEQIVESQQTSEPQPTVATAPAARPSVASATVGLPILDEAVGSPSSVQAAASTTALPAMPAGDRLGESPALYNGALNTALSPQPSQTASLKPASETPLTQSGNDISKSESPTSSSETLAMGVQMPATSTLPSTVTTPAATSQPNQTSGNTIPTQFASGPNRLPTGTASNQVPTRTVRPTNTAVVPGGPMVTDNPTMDPRAVIEAWRNYKAEQIAQPPQSDNRYLPPPAR